MPIFDGVRIARPRLNRFDLSHEYKASFNMGELIPAMCEEVLPGDRFRVRSEIMLRFSPMLAPIMHRVDVYTHYFFVPNRIIWDDWEDFITGGEDGTEAPVWPHFSTSGLESGSTTTVGGLPDYLGLPIIPSVPAESVLVSALPFRAYTEIFNEYYRDQTLRTEVPNSKTSGLQSAYQNTSLRTRAWERDYFTSALPWTQRGAAVSLDATINYKNVSDVVRDDTDVSVGNVFINPNTTSPPSALAATAMTGAGTGGRIENLESIGIDINSLRQSNALQKWLEKAARIGSRYKEQLLGMFGVVSPDGRLQRPEYLGGGKQHVMISEVLQTAEGASLPVGQTLGHGISVGATNQFSRRFTEHGFVLAIVSVLPKTSYHQGIHRMWSRSDKFDYYFPDFAHLGEQAIEEKELFYDETTTGGADTWGYQSRYAEMKYCNSRIAGDFRSSLNYWHMGRTFTSVPPLAAAFVESDPTHRIFANTTPTDHKMYMQCYHNFSALRPIPIFSDPKLIP